MQPMHMRPQRLNARAGRQGKRAAPRLPGIRLLALRDSQGRAARAEQQAPRHWPRPSTSLLQPPPPRGLGALWRQVARVD